MVFDKLFGFRDKVQEKVYETRKASLEKRKERETVKADRRTELTRLQSEVETLKAKGRKSADKKKSGKSKLDDFKKSVFGQTLKNAGSVSLLGNRGSMKMGSTSTSLGNMRLGASKPRKRKKGEFRSMFDY